MIGQLMTRFGSDKDTGHSYGPVYDQLFAPVRDKVTSFLEIGILYGASLRAWEEYFYNARIVAIDHHATLVNEGRIQSFRADSTDRNALDAVLGDMAFDVIVDDGCHWYHEQKETWRNLYWRLKPGGVYVIEDLQEEGAHAGFTELGATIFDRRSVKGRGDDVLAVFHKKEGRDDL